MKTLNVERSVRAPLESVWQLVSDVGNYAKYAPNIDSSKIVSGEGVGLIRACGSKEGRWQEFCTSWHDKDCYEFEIQTQAHDYPFPFKMLHGKWSVDPINTNHTIIRMKFDLEFKNKAVGWLLYPVMKIQFMKICEELLDNWQTALEI